MMKLMDWMKGPRRKYCAHHEKAKDHPYANGEDDEGNVSACKVQTLEWLEWKKNPIRGVYIVEMAGREITIVCREDLEKTHVPTAEMKRRYGQSCPFFDPADGYSWETLTEMGDYELRDGELKYKGI